jgi:hypothetical protein
MKTLIVILLGVAGLHTVAAAQDIPQTQVPAVVLNAFQSKYQNTKDLEWELKGELYKAEFEIGSRDHEVWINKSGVITRHKEDFPKSQLPEVIREKIAKDFKDYKIDDADKIEADGKVFYQVDLDSPQGERKLLFTADGQLQENKQG